MKKQILISAFAIMSLFIISSVFASEVYIPAVQKNPSTWDPIANGYKSTIMGYQVNTVVWKPCGISSCKTYQKIDYMSVVPSGKVKPSTNYTLVYYGSDDYNDQWNHVTCIVSKKSSSEGYLSMNGKFKWSTMINDGLDQKFWIVPTKDLDCENNQFSAWNPTEILFETKTI